MEIEALLAINKYLKQLQILGIDRINSIETMTTDEGVIIYKIYYSNFIDSINQSKIIMGYFNSQNFLLSETLSTGKHKKYRLIYGDDKHNYIFKYIKGFELKEDFEVLLKRLILLENKKVNYEKGYFHI